MNILSVCYYYIFPNSTDDYVILDYDKKYNEIIEYVEYSEKVYKTSKLELIKTNTYHLSKDLIKKGKIAIQFIGIKLLDILAELYYHNYNTINMQRFSNLNNSIRLLPPLKRKYIPRPIEQDCITHIEYDAGHDVQNFMEQLESELRHTPLPRQLQIKEEPPLSHPSPQLSDISRFLEID